MARYQEKETYDDLIEKDKYAAPIPGQSLTDEPGRWAWENPPKITDPDEAVSFVITRFEQSQKTQSAYTKLITAGMPIESLVNTISFGGFVEGQWTVDIAEIIKPPLMSFFIAFADEYQLPYRVFNNPTELEDDGIGDEQTLHLMAERNPRAFEQVQQSIELDLNDMIQKEQGFLGTPPDMGGEEPLPAELPAEPNLEQEIG
tara:strand:- start:893 stop:1498 length:606 start_codon:yes stop_codon:yes gene_type:complete